MFMRTKPGEIEQTESSKKKQQKAIARVTVAQRMGLKPSAREMFAYLRPILLASRPLIAYNDEPAKYGKPTFRNVIDPVTGKHV